MREIALQLELARLGAACARELGPEAFAERGEDIQLDRLRREDIRPLRHHAGARALDGAAFQHAQHAEFVFREVRAQAFFVAHFAAGR